MTLSTDQLVSIPLPNGLNYLNVSYVSAMGYGSSPNSYAVPSGNYYKLGAAPEYSYNVYINNNDIVLYSFTGTASVEFTFTITIVTNM